MKVVDFSNKAVAIKDNAKNLGSVEEPVTTESNSVNQDVITAISHTKDGAHNAKMIAIKPEEKTVDPST